MHDIKQHVWAESLQEATRIKQQEGLAQPTKDGRFNSCNASKLHVQAQVTAHDHQLILAGSLIEGPDNAGSDPIVSQEPLPY